MYHNCGKMSDAVWLNSIHDPVLLNAILYNKYNHFNTEVKN